MIFIEVRCDKCGSVGLSRRCFYAHQMREELKKAGWKHVAEGGKLFAPSNHDAGCMRWGMCDLPQGASL